MTWTGGEQLPQAKARMPNESDNTYVSDQRNRLHGKARKSAHVKWPLSNVQRC